MQTSGRSSTCRVIRPALCCATVVSGLLLAGCSTNPAQPYGLAQRGTPPVVAGDAPAPRPANIPTQVDNASVYTPIWMTALANDAATAGMTVGGMELTQRVKAALADREALAKRLDEIDLEEQAGRAVHPPAPTLPTPAVGGTAEPATERKLASNLITREAATAGEGMVERKTAGALATRGAVTAAERATEKRVAGKLLMRGAVVGAEEGEGLWMLLRILPFL